MLHELNHIQMLTNIGTFTQVSLSGPWVKAQAVQTINLFVVFPVHRDTVYPKSSLNLCQSPLPVTCPAACHFVVYCGFICLYLPNMSHTSSWTLSFHIKFSTSTHWIIKVYKIGGEMYKHNLYILHLISYYVTSCL